MSHGTHKQQEYTANNPVSALGSRLAAKRSYPILTLSSSQCMLGHPISQADKHVIYFDSLSMDMETQAKRGDMLWTANATGTS